MAHDGVNMGQKSYPANGIGGCPGVTIFRYACWWASLSNATIWLRLKPIYLTEACMVS